LARGLKFLAGSDDLRNMAVQSQSPRVQPDSRRSTPGQEAKLAEEARTMLLDLSQDFDGQAADNRRLIRDLAGQDWHAFYSAAVEILKDRHDSNCALYVIKLLIGRDLLVDALCDPALSKEQAVAVGRAAARIDPMTDVSLAKFLADRSAPDDTVQPAELMRLMEIMVEVSSFVRVLPVLKRMSRHPNPHVRSKAVLMIGRGNPASGWLQNRFAEPDPRIRANTVESLWGVDTEEARGLLLAAARDDNNRVSGNALLALYRLGEPSAEPELRKMAENEAALFRASSAWVMGEIADPQFAGILARLVGDSSQMVRKRAFSALGKIAAKTRAKAGLSTG
jgi:HEAT repeat protein